MIPPSLPPTMLRLVLTVTVLTHGLALAASPPPQNCTDVEVTGDKLTRVKKFTSQEGKLLFFPGQDFEGVTIKFTVAGIRTGGKKITREDLCVNSSQWYSLHVTVHHESEYFHCTLKTNYCSTDCDELPGGRYVRFNRITVSATGLSVWSLNINEKTQCATPALIRPWSTDISEPASKTSNTSGGSIASTLSGSATLPIVIIGVVSGAVVLAAVVIVTSIARSSLRTLCLRKRQQQLTRSSNETHTHPFGHSNSGMAIHLEDVSTHNTEVSHSASSCHIAD